MCLIPKHHSSEKLNLLVFPKNKILVLFFDLLIFCFSLTCALSLLITSCFILLVFSYTVEH